MKNPSLTKERHSATVAATRVVKLKLSVRVVPCEYINRKLKRRCRLLRGRLRTVFLLANNSVKNKGLMPPNNSKESREPREKMR